ASTRPVPSTTDDYVNDARPLEEVRIDVLKNDFNPFADEGPLRLLEVSVETGDASTRVEDSVLTVIPSATMVGTVTVRYTMVDVTGDADRTVEGRAYVTVMNRPDAPPKPQIKTV